ncbi:MAG TPA: arginine deiminase family protein [Vicinamibacterales bacterium]|nr:arginine deiminase family protein [Vicinamibacterales bacterium]
MGAAVTFGLVRRPPATYAPAYSSRGIAIDQQLASSQHAKYVEALESANVSVQTIDGDPAYYDSVFVEDTAIVWGSAALIVNMGGRHRDGEQHAVRAILGKSHTLADVPAGGRIDGGDVLHCDETTFVGRSSRTNQIGIDALCRFLEPFGRQVIAVPVERALHLKTAVTYLGDGVVIAARDLIGLDAMSAFEIVTTAPAEAGAANCLRVGKHLLIPSGYPATEKVLANFAVRRGVTIHRLDISEFEKGGGGLTCLSLLWSPGHS